MWEFYLEVLCLCEELSGGYLEDALIKVSGSSLSSSSPFT
jgi:hypothetical protein